MGEPLRHARRGAGAARRARPADALGGGAADLVSRALSGLAAFRRAVDEHALVPPELDPAAVAAARAALDRCGLLLVGEAHGVAETPALLHALVGALDADGLALEWTAEEVGAPLERFLATGELQLEELWALGPQADFFAGDGRVTAGHFALLRRLGEERRLRQLVAFDVVTTAQAHWAVRERAMAARLLGAWRRDVRLVAVAGAFHVRSSAEDGEPLGALLTRAVPGVGLAQLEYAGGSCWFHGVRRLEPSRPAGTIVFRLGEAHPAVVPRP